MFVLVQENTTIGILLPDSQRLRVSSDLGAFPPKNQFFWAYVNTEIAPGCGTKQADHDG